MLLDLFGFVSENACLFLNFLCCFEKIVLIQNNNFVLFSSLLLIDYFIKQYHGTTREETKCRQEGCLSYQPDQTRGTSVTGGPKQKRLKQEEISWYEDSPNYSTKRNYNNNDDELSVVVSAAKLPKTIQGHNMFDIAPHWTTPKLQSSLFGSMALKGRRCY